MSFFVFTGDDGLPSYVLAKSLRDAHARTDYRVRCFKRMSRRQWKAAR